MKSLENYRFFHVFRGIEIRLNSLDISSESGDDTLGILEKKIEHRSRNWLLPRSKISFNIS